MRRRAETIRIELPLSLITDLIEGSELAAGAWDLTAKGLEADAAAGDARAARLRRQAQAAARRCLRLSRVLKRQLPAAPALSSRRAPRRSARRPPRRRVRATRPKAAA